MKFDSFHVNFYFLGHISKMYVSTNALIDFSMQRGRALGRAQGEAASNEEVPGRGGQSLVRPSLGGHFKKKPLIQWFRELESFRHALGRVCKDAGSGSRLQE